MFWNRTVGIGAAGSALLLSGVLLLSACGSEKADPNARAAGGEVLPGTISDAMIDLDRSTATPPLVPARASKAGPAETAAAEDAGAATAAAADAPQAEPPATSPAKSE